MVPRFASLSNHLVSISERVCRSGGIKSTTGLAPRAISAGSRRPSLVPAAVPSPSSRSATDTRTAPAAFAPRDRSRGTVRRHTASLEHLRRGRARPRQRGPGSRRPHPRAAENASRAGRRSGQGRRSRTSPPSVSRGSSRGVPPAHRATRRPPPGLSPEAPRLSRGEREKSGCSVRGWGLPKRTNDRQYPLQEGKRGETKERPQRAAIDTPPLLGAPATAVGCRAAGTDVGYLARTV